MADNNNENRQPPRWVTDIMTKGFEKNKFPKKPLPIDLAKFCSKPATMGELMNEVEKWQQKYDITFQFWHLNNTVYIEKDLVNLIQKYQIYFL